MLIRRFRFTIQQLIKLVAICAVSFDILRTPAAPFFVIIVFILIGFDFERAKGGTVFFGGTLGGGIVCLSFEIFSGHFYFSRPELLFVPSIVGLIAGAVISTTLFPIIFIIKCTKQRINQVARFIGIRCAGR